MGGGFLPHVTTAPTEGFFHPDLFLVDLCVQVIMKNRVKSVFFEVINSSAFNVFNNIKITLHYIVYMRTSGQKVLISDEAERVQSVSYSHIRSLPRLYTVVCLRKGKQGTCLGPPFETVMCKVAYLAFKWGSTATTMYKCASLLSNGPATAVVM